MSLAQRHTVYIRCTPPELWAALTEGERSREYFYESAIESSFEVGGPVRYVVPANADEDRGPIVALEGEIVESVPEQTLAYSLRFTDLDEPSTTVRFSLTPLGPRVVRLDVVHDGFAAQSASWARVDEGWPVILSGLKTLLETGEPLRVVGGPGPEPRDDDDHDHDHDHDEEPSEGSA